MPSKKKAPTSSHVPLHNASPRAAATAPSQPLPRPAAASKSTDGAHAAPKDAESRTGDTTESAGEPTVAATVNRKKQKRREKEAARRAADQNLANGHVDDGRPDSNGPLPFIKGRGPVKGYFTEEPDLTDPAYVDVDSPEQAFYSGDEDPHGELGVDAVPDSSWLNTSKRKKAKGGGKGAPTDTASLSRTSTAPAKPNIPSLSKAAMRASQRLSNDQIWNTSTQAERENIKQFWLELGEDERRSLVKVEKEAVLRKMKEQQKHSCSCSVCGRKRTAIEEELEVLYDAYYEELEQFANHNADLSNVPQMMAPPRPLFKRVALPMAGSYPSRGRVHEMDDDEDDLDDDDEYDDEDEEPYSDEDADYDDPGLPTGPPDFFQFGNSLTVKDGILTVADDLLKNDGKHFIDMMEQLAERRMQRHNHPPLDDDDEDYDDEEDDEDYDSQDDEDFEGDEMDSMTEEQRMEEGRRMFQIFAARMFEQRVLTAYREKVAAERQRKLLEELDEESRLDTQREAKKAREAAKRKEKKRMQKQAKDEEKAKKDAEKAAHEAAARELEEKKLEEQRQRKEELRKKREAEKKAAEDERLRKDAEKHRKQQEQRERQAEQERKQREAKERERQKREDARKKERQEREAKEKERKANEERDKKAKEDQAKKEKNAGPKAERAAHKDRHPHPAASGPKQQPVALPPGLHPPSRSSSMQSPHLPAATPTLSSKAPTPGRNRQSSQAGPQSHGSSPPSQKASTDISRSSASPATVAMPQTPGAAHAKGPPPVLHHPQPSAPRSPLSNPGRGQYPLGMNGLPGLGVSGPPAIGAQNAPSNVVPSMPMYPGPPIGSQPRAAPNGQQPPGFPRHFQPGQQMPFVPQAATPMASLASQPVGPKSSVHSRQASIDTTAQPAPIARPGPIARPSSATPEKQKPLLKSPDFEVDQLTTQLGSKALLDDSDAPFFEHQDTRMNFPPVGPPGSSRPPFANSFAEPKQEPFGASNATWSSFNPAMTTSPGWGPPPIQRPNQGWAQPPFGAIGPGPQPGSRSHLPRPIAVRVMLVQACRQLSQMPGASSDGYHPVQSVLRQLDLVKAPHEPLISMDEMLGICDTEGNAQNGGGSFEVVVDQVRGQVIKFVEDTPSHLRSSVGEIGSPVLGHSQHVQPGPFGGLGTSSFGLPGRGF